MDLEKNKTAFGSLAENYQKYRRGYPGELYDKLFSLLGPKPVVLDLGCGTGKSTEPLVSRAQRVVGADADPLMLEQAKQSANEKNLQIEYVESAAEHLPFADGSFDAVISGAAFHWFSNDEAMKEIYRVLKPGGTLFVFWIRGEEMEDDNQIDPLIFDKYNWKFVPAPLRDQAAVKKLMEIYGLVSIEADKIQYTEEYSLDEYVGLETTASHFALLSPEEKEGFIEDATNNLRAKLGDRRSFVIKQRVELVYGKKAQ